ncbi:MAG TPA: Ppx/GppA phosphatase family protein [Polyangiaceae bacterium]
MTSPVAAVDIGTNSVRLLVIDEAGQALERQMKVTRLGQGVDVSGELHPDAIARTTAVLGEYAARIAYHGATRVRAVATSAARDAHNRDVFFGAAERALGVRPELLSGEAEARLSFRGATFGLDAGQGPFLVVDIGGGSTEFVLGTSEPEALTSVKMGCVRMTERYLRSDPPSEAELAACFSEVKRILATVSAVVDVSRSRCMIGLAGTVTSIAALVLGLTGYAPEKTHHSRIDRAQVEQAFARLVAVGVEQRRTLLIQPERAEIIIGGAAVLLSILQEFAIGEVLVSESDILDGLAASVR